MDNSKPDTIAKLLLVETEPGKFGGFKRSSIYENLSERDEAFTLCYVCKGLMKGACNVEEEDRLACEECAKGKRANAFAICRRSIAEIKLRCPLLKRGCDWIGKSEGAEQHLQECKYLLIECPLKCELAVMSGNMEEHMTTECANRNVICRFCEEVFSLFQTENHKSECLEYLIECMPGCGVTLKRKDLGAHLGELCPYGVVECDFSEIGCTVETIIRKEKPQHNETHASYHLTLMGKSQIELKSLISELKKELSDGKKAMECLEETVRVQAHEISELESNQSSFKDQIGNIGTDLEILKEIMDDEPNLYCRHLVDMTIRGISVLKKSGFGATAQEFKIDQYELDCYCMVKDGRFLGYLRVWDGSRDGMLRWPFSAECELSITPVRKGCVAVEHKPVRVNLQRVAKEQKTLLEMSKDLHKIGENSTELIGDFPLGILLTDKYLLKDSLQMQLKIKCLNIE